MHTKDMNVSNFEILRREQQKGILQTQERINQLHRFKGDYVNLKDRLETLSDKTSYDVMVPFGPHALMAGRLIHTNEITVLLGDNYFVERSAKQAKEIVERRIKHCDENLEKLHVEEKQFQDWLNYTTEVTEDITQRETVDLFEEYNEEEDRKWREKHKRRLKDAIAKRKSEDQQSAHGSASPQNHHRIDGHGDSYLDRLDSLMQCENACIENEIGQGDQVHQHMPELERRKSVTFTEPTVETDSDVSEESDFEGSTITFRHSDVQPEDIAERTNPDQTDRPSIRTPADIYNVYGKSSTTVKSILKVHQGEPPRKPTIHYSDPVDSRNEPPTRIYRNQTTVVKETVMEHNADSRLITSDNTRRISKFKQSRLK